MNHPPPKGSGLLPMAEVSTGDPHPIEIFDLGGVVHFPEFLDKNNLLNIISLSLRKIKKSLNSRSSTEQGVVLARHTSHYCY